MKRILLILVLGFWMIPSKAQYSFNKRETMHSINSIFTSVIPKNGKYYCTGVCLDSINYVGSSNTWYTRFGIKFSVFDESGNKLIDTVYQRNYYTIFPWSNTLCARADGTFLLVAEETDTAGVLRNILICFDSIGHMLWNKEYDQPFCTNNPWYKVQDFKPTGTGGWLILSLEACAIPGAGHPNDFILTKLDSSFNVIWNKEYGDINMNDDPNKILVAPDGYLLAGGRSNDNIADKNFTYRAELIKTDTDGNQQWQWLSSGALISTIMDVTRTQDGGYVYCGAGNGYEQLDASQQYGTVYFHGWVQKLDANRNPVWGKSYNNWTGTTNFKKIMETSSGNLLVFGDKYVPVIQDSIHGDFHTKGWFMTLDANGDSLKERTYKYLYTCYDFNSLNDVKQTSDGGFIMVGESTDHCGGATAPIQRGWLVKVDSNGCLYNDPQCWPLIIKQEPLKEDVRVYPNPVRDFLQIDTKLNNAAIELTDITGRILLHQNLSSSSHIDMSNYATGVYLYRISSNGSLQKQGKVVKE